jgi:hypothetical protein
MRIRPAALAAMVCVALASFGPAAHAGDWAPSPSGDCVDLASMTADAQGRKYFRVYHSGSLSCRAMDSAPGVAVDCSQAVTAMSHDRIKFYTYSPGSRQWEPAEIVPDKAFAATLIFACVADW